MRVPVARLVCLIACAAAVAVDQYFQRAALASLYSACSYESAPTILLSLPWLVIGALQAITIRRPVTPAYDWTGAGVVALYAAVSAWAWLDDSWTCHMGDTSEAEVLPALLFFYIAVPFSVIYLVVGLGIYLGRRPPRRATGSPR
jgi:hypothetical protein